MSTAITLPPDFSPLIALVTDTLDSPHSRRAYTRALADFLAWVAEKGRPSLSKALITEYRRHLVDAGLSPASVNQRLSAIRKLAAEAADNGLLDETTAQAVGRVKGERQEGRRLGNWLTLKQAQKLVNAPDTETMKGLRDRALLAVLVGCGLRREEAASLTFEHVQQRAGRWVIVDLVGKRGRVRSVPMPAWVKACFDAWQDAAGLHDGAVFHSMAKGGAVRERAMTPQAIYYVVAEYTDVAPHDLRRTWAKLAYEHGAPLEQVQITLGHASIQTTERYLGVELDLQKGAADYIPIKLQHKQAPFAGAR